MVEEKEQTELIPMNIIDEKKQLSIRIPKKVVEALGIDPKKDVFVFNFDKKNLHLEGELADKSQIKIEYGE